MGMERMSNQVRTTCAPYVALFADDHWWLPDSVKAPLERTKSSRRTPFLDVLRAEDERDVHGALDALWPVLASYDASVIGVAIGGLPQPDQPMASLRALAGDRWSDEQLFDLGREGVRTAAYRLPPDEGRRSSATWVLLFVHGTPRSLLPDSASNPTLQRPIEALVEDYVTEVRQALKAHAAVPVVPVSEAPPGGFAATSRRYDKVVRDISALEKSRAAADREQHGLERIIARSDVDGRPVWAPMRRELAAQAEQRAEFAEALRAELRIVEVAFARVSAANDLRWSRIGAGAGVLSLVIAIIALSLSIG